MNLVTVRRLLAIAPLCAACAGPAEREADELAGLRERATAGIEAVEVFCTARDSAIARVQRGGPGTDILLEEVLLTPVVLDDYCEEFRHHEHGDEPHDDEAAPPASPGSDTTVADSVARPAG